MASAPQRQGDLFDGMTRLDDRPERPLDPEPEDDGDRSRRTHRPLEEMPKAGAIPPRVYGAGHVFSSVELREDFEKRKGEILAKMREGWKLGHRNTALFEFVTGCKPAAAGIGNRAPVQRTVPTLGEQLRGAKDAPPPPVFDEAPPDPDAWDDGGEAE